MPPPPRHAMAASTRRKQVSRVMLLGLASVLLLAAAIVGANVVLTLKLFGAEQGVSRLKSDWRRIWVAHAISTGQMTTPDAYSRVYGKSIGRAPQPQDVRRWLADDLSDQRPIAWDFVLASYLVERFGAVDGRSVPPGVYVAAGPIGPNQWPWPILSHYLLFARHGYILVVPPPGDGQARPALAAAASWRRDFRPGGDGDDLIAMVQVYGPDAFDFPTAGGPVQDLFLLSSDHADIVTVENRIRATAARLGESELGYGLFSRNSNSVLRCFLKVSGLPDDKVDAIRHQPLSQIRLPGIGQSLWKADERGGVAECSGS